MTDRATREDMKQAIRYAGQHDGENYLRFHYDGRPPGFGRLFLDALNFVWPWVVVAFIGAGIAWAVLP